MTRRVWQAVPSSAAAASEEIASASAADPGTEQAYGPFDTENCYMLNRAGEKVLVEDMLTDSLWGHGDFESPC